MWQKYWKDRGNPWEYDPGPTTGQWAQLFAATPNYRGIGVKLEKSEQFRWHFGPMFYRGRLTDGGVKVLIIGQEGAQDESLAHRSFAGGTGARMQHFLNHIGITRSYLFLNTFVYPIFGQYDADLVWMAQHPDSPIVQHRHRILNEVIARNDVRLVVAVGKAAKESVVTWIRSRGGNCPAGDSDVSTCTAGVLDAKTRTAGVLHPGGAGKGGNVTAIVQSFKKLIGQIEEWSAIDPTWLPADAGATRHSADSFKYRSAPIPFRDLPYGSAWRIGRGGTSSNRKDNQRSIQMFSAAGKYNGSSSYSTNGAGNKDGYQQKPGDLAYEPARVDFADFDPGPPAAMAKLLMGGETGLDWPDFETLGAIGHPSLGFGPAYRGRFQNVKLLVIADQESHDDLFLGRAATGDGGQHLQAFLEAAGGGYLILRSLPVDTMGMTAARAKEIVNHAAVRAIYAEVLRRVASDNSLRAILAVGPLAAELAANTAPAGANVIRMKAFHAQGWLADWKSALSALGGPGAYNGERKQIPRADLPYGTLRWQGSSGDRGARASDPAYYKIFMPKWAFDLKPEPLSAAEISALQNAPGS
jgi:hypothetical protein